MLKVIFLSFFFFLVEVSLFINFKGEILERVTQINLDYLSFKSAPQIRVFEGIQKINHANKLQGKKVFILGGSTAREFFLDDNSMSKLLGVEFVNLGVSAQTLIDSIRLIEKIDSKDALVIYAMYPTKFFGQTSNKLHDSKYFYGATYAYPIKSLYADELLETKNIRAQDSSLEIFSELNVFVALINDFFLRKKKDLTKVLKKELPFSRLFINKDHPEQFLYKDLTISDKKLRKKLRTYHKRNKPVLDENLKFHFELLEELIKVSKKKNLKLVLMDLPHSSTCEDVLGELIDAYEINYTKFLQSNPVKRYKFNLDEFSTSQKYFYDHGHLYDVGREYYLPHSIETISDALKHSR